MPPSMMLEDYAIAHPLSFYQNTVKGVLAMIERGVPVGLRDPSGLSLFVNHLKYQSNPDPVQASLVVLDYVQAFGEQFLVSMHQALSQLSSSSQNHYSFWLVAAWAQSHLDLEQCLSGISYFQFSGEVKDSHAHHGRKLKEPYDWFVWLAAVHLEQTPALKNQWKDRIQKFKQNAVSPQHQFLLGLLLMERIYEDTDGEPEYLPNYEELEWSPSFTAQTFKAVVSEFPQFQGLVTHAFIHSWTFLSEKPRSFCDGSLEDLSFFLGCLQGGEDFKAIWKNADPYEKSQIAQCLGPWSHLHDGYLSEQAASLNETNYRQVVQETLDCLLPTSSKADLTTRLLNHYQEHCKKDNARPMPQLEDYFRLIHEVKPLTKTSAPAPGLTRF